MQREIWFWQRIVSPHMAGLARALAARGVRVTYVAQEQMSAERARQGWLPAELGEARLRLATRDEEIAALVTEAPPAAVHVCQGVRGNGLVGRAQRLLARQGRRQWVIMETPDDGDWRYPLRRGLYRWNFWRRRASVEGVLAIGACTPAWLEERGVPAARIFPFAYFLPPTAPLRPAAPEGKERFRIAFVGQFVALKRLDLLVAALERLAHPAMELEVIGSGPLEAGWRQLAEAALPGRVRWQGRKTMSEVHDALAAADCLVLPSRHDGWGAVVSEALMAGTPAICSDRCGSAEAVVASGEGGIFHSGDVADLARVLRDQVARGVVTPRRRAEIAHWAQGLGADAGAGYLLDILDFSEGGADRPVPPWRKWRQDECVE